MAARCWVRLVVTSASSASRTCHAANAAQHKADSDLILKYRPAVGTGPVLRALADELEASPWGLLPAFPPAPLPAPLRAAAVHALQSAIKVHSFTL